MAAKNKHHLLYCKNEWNKKPTSKLLRNNDYCKVMLPILVHRDLHADPELFHGSERVEGQVCTKIISAIAAAKKAKRIDVDKDNPVRRLEFLINLLVCYTDEDETIESLKRQRDFLLDAYRKGRL